jgi:acyl-coenzyme A thioesterase PaaI-like protein
LDSSLNSIVDDTDGKSDEAREFLQMIEALRAVQVRIAEARPTPQVSVEITRKLEQIAAQLGPFSVPDEQRIAGRLLDVPGRGQALVPPIVLSFRDAARMVGIVRLSAVHLGSGGAAHGGVVPLIFDEFMGKLSNKGWIARTRTACLHVNYRVFVPADVDLRIEVKLEREEGRKLFVSGTLQKDDTLLADANALFVIPRTASP